MAIECRATDDNCGRYDYLDDTAKCSVNATQTQLACTNPFVNRAASLEENHPRGDCILAVALGVQAITQGLSVYFVTLTQMIEDLKRAYEENRLERRLRIYARPKILLIDEVGCAPRGA